MVVKEGAIAFFCLSLLSACGYLNTDDLTVNPYPNGSAKQTDLNCRDRFAKPSGGSYQSREHSEWMQHVVDCQSRGQGQNRLY